MPRKKTESKYYEPVRKALEERFKAKFGNCHLEVTADGEFTNKLKSAIPSGYGMTLYFIGRRKSPDVTGFVEMKEVVSSDIAFIIGDKKSEKFSVNWREFIVVEVKDKKITLDNVCQARTYGLMFRAKYAFLMSLKPIPEEIERLAKETNLLSMEYEFVIGRKQTNLRIAQFYTTHKDSGEIVCDIPNDRWFPDNPFGNLKST
jgi:hypothetical protein